MTFDEYVKEVFAVRQKYPEWRLGQTYFNVLAKHRPDIAEYIRGLWKLDPFYRDDVIRPFLDYVAARWIGTDDSD